MDVLTGVTAAAVVASDATSESAAGGALDDTEISGRHTVRSVFGDV